MVSVPLEGNDKNCNNDNHDSGASTKKNEPGTSKDVESNEKSGNKPSFLQKTATIALVLMKIEPKCEPANTTENTEEGAKNIISIEDDPLEKVKRPLPTVRATQVLLVGLLISILVIGCVFLTDCNIDPKIPIYLIITGVLGIAIKIILNFYKEQLQTILTLSITIMLIVHILGTIWVYRIYLPNFDPEKFEGYYCHRTVYLFAFWLITIENALLSLFIVISMCYMLMRSSFKSF